MSWTRSDSQRGAVKLLIVCGLAFAGLMVHPANRDAFGVDFLHFWGIPQFLIDGGADSVYASQSHPQIIDFLQEQSALPHGQRLEGMQRAQQDLYETGLLPTGTPCLYATLGAWQTGNFEFDFWAFQLVSNGIWLLGWILLGRVLNAPFWVMIATAGLCFLICSPLIIDIRVANTNRLQAGGMMIGLFGWAQGAGTLNRVQRPAIGWAVGSGVLLGGLVVFKPNLLLAPVLLGAGGLLVGELRRTLGLSLGCILGATLGVTAGGLLFGGAHAWLDWWRAIRALAQEPFPVSDGNYSPLSLVPTAWIPILAPIMTLLLLAWILRMAIRRSRWNGEQDERPVRELSLLPIQLAALGCLIPLLAAPIAWAHYYVLAMPAIGLLGPGLIHGTRAGRVWATVGIVIWTGLPMHWLHLEPTWQALVLTSGVVILLAAGVAGIGRGGERSVDQTVEQADQQLTVS